MTPSNRTETGARYADSRETQPSQYRDASEQQVDLSDNALVVLEKRYLRKDGDGNVVETPGQMLRRVARAIAQAETIYGTRADAAHWEDEFYDVMARLDFVPNSPTLMNAGHRPAGRVGHRHALRLLRHGPRGHYGRHNDHGQGDGHGSEVRRRHWVRALSNQTQGLRESRPPTARHAAPYRCCGISPPCRSW